MEVIESAEQKKRLKTNEQSLRDLWVSQDKREKGAKRIFEEIMCKNFPNLKEDMNISIQELRELQVRLSSKRPTLGHIRQRHGEKAVGEKQMITNRGFSIR